MTLEWDIATGEPLLRGGSARLVGHGMYRGDGPQTLRDFVDAGADIRAVVTDPPYGVLLNEDIAKPRVSKTGHEGVLTRSAEWETQTRAATLDNYRQLFDAAAALKNAWVHAFVCDRTMSYVIELGEAAGLKYHMPYVLWKSNPPPRIRRRLWRSAIELSCVFSIGKPQFYETNAHNAVRCPFVSGMTRRHFAQKPEPLLRALVEAYTAPGELVFDPFAGSGSTVREARRLGRLAVGVEVDSTMAAGAAMYVGGLEADEDISTGERRKTGNGKGRPKAA